jgi:hypothetical protein
MRPDTFLSNDDWYVRFPDGKVLHAATTNTVRKNIDRGRIPLESTVRRSADEEWVTLAWTSEFADLVKRRADGVARTPKSPRRRRAVTTNGKASSTSTRLDPHKLQTVGVRSFLPELLAAVENTVMQRKLVAIAVSGLLLGGLFALAQYPLPDLGGGRLWFNIVLGLLAGLVVAATGALLTRATFIELSQLRPAKPEEVRTGWTARTIRLFVAQLVTAGVAIGLIALLRGLPLPAEEPTLAWQVAGHVAVVISVVGEVLLWVAVFLTLLLPPIMVVESASVEGSLSHWWKLLRQYPGTVLLYEVLAAGIGLVLALVPALPLFFLSPPADGPLSLTAAATRNVLLCLPAALWFAYLTVANVFIYLHLRYETPAGRE